MITENRKTGICGELYAARYLRRKGYRILTANYSVKYGEIDIIAQTGEIICFVEVKTRDDFACFLPSDAVDEEKKHNIRRTAAAYMAVHKEKLIERFDIIEVIVSDEKYQLRHIENAF